MVELVERELTRSVIGAFFDVYNDLGYGFLEAVYARALEHELRLRGHGVAREQCVQVMYKGEAIGVQRLDMVVDGKLVVEAKASVILHPSALRQLYNYLRATDLEIGLLLHFGLEPQFHRLVNSYRKSASIRHDPRHPHSRC